MKIVNEKQLNEIVKTTKIVFVDFSAVWCSPCQMLGKLLEKSVVPKYAKDKTIEFVKVDIDKSGRLATKHKIESVPCMEIYHNGEKVNLNGTEEGRIIGLRPDIVEVIKNIITSLKSGAIPAVPALSE